MEDPSTSPSKICVTVKTQRCISEMATARACPANLSADTPGHIELRGIALQTETELRKRNVTDTYRDTTVSDGGAANMQHRYTFSPYNRCCSCNSHLAIFWSSSSITAMVCTGTALSNDLICREGEEKESRSQ